MTSHNFKSRNGSTPLDPGQLKGIKYSHVTTMGELDELEDENIQRGLDWLNRYKKNDYLSTAFLLSFHRKLFGDVWNWAGQFRKVEVNLAHTKVYNIGPELKLLFENVFTQIEHKSMHWDDIAAEFHHKLVSIHPFPNGNGRTTRLMTEYLQKRNGHKVTTWMASMNDHEKRQELYIKSLKAADRGDYDLLIQFMQEKR